MFGVVYDSILRHLAQAGAAVSCPSYDTAVCSQHQPEIKYVGMPRVPVHQHTPQLRVRGCRLKREVTSDGILVPGIYEE